MDYMLMFYEPAAQFEQRRDRVQSQPYWAAWMAYVQAMHASGVVRAAPACRSRRPATTVRVRDGKRRVQDGPFADTKEQLGGFFVIDVPDLDTALDWAARARARRTAASRFARSCRRRRRTSGRRATRGAAAAVAARDSYGRLIALPRRALARHRRRRRRARRRVRAALRHWPVDGVPDAPEAWLLPPRGGACSTRWRHGRVRAEAEATPRARCAEEARRRARGERRSRTSG